jgi:hypothetical protein
VDEEVPAPARVDHPRQRGTNERQGTREVLASTAPTRKQAPLLRALLEACGLDPDAKMTPSEGRAAGVAANGLKHVDATPEDVHARAAAFRRLWPEVSLTPHALVRQWAQCMVTPGDKIVGAVRPQKRRECDVCEGSGWDVTDAGAVPCPSCRAA